MKKIKQFSMLLFVVALTLLTSCKKDEVTYGNTDMSTSNSVQVNNWYSNYDDGVGFQFCADINWGGITQSIIDDGVVLVYMKDGDAWMAIPYSDAGNNYFFSFNFEISLNTVRLILNGYDNGGSPNPSDFNGEYFKIVTLSKHQVKENPNVDLTSYEDVSNAFKL